MTSRAATTEHRDTEPSSSARFYLCVRCYSHALICSSCDRGQIYCTPECAREGEKNDNGVHGSDTRPALAAAPCMLNGAADFVPDVVP